MFGSRLIAFLALVATARAQWDTNCASGRHVIVHLFEWKWTDIAAECERFLGPMGYCGVQVSPPNEHRVITNPYRPWYERYQPVSYQMKSRSGNEDQFKDMVTRCNNVNVRIYVDAVINHMTGGGTGTGSGGSYWNADTLNYPGVPWSSWDFNDCSMCGTRSCNIEDYNNANQVRNCRLLGLRDIKLGKDYCRETIAGFMNKLIDWGVAGFRIDASKHMWPGDMQNIFNRLKNLQSKWFSAGSRSFIFQEVIDMGYGEPITSDQYVHLGTVTEFKYGKNLGDIIRKNSNQKLRYLNNFGQSWGMLSDKNALVFVDNHDNQRGHGAGGFGSILTFFEARMYKIANAFMLAWPYGSVRVMSSYNWDRSIQNGKDVNDWQGPPSFGDGTTKDVTINSDNTCGNGWICEHRWRQIYGMVKFHNVVSGTWTNDWWDNGNNQIAFARGNRGFIAINNDNYYMDQWLQTGLSAGVYCDVISGSKEGGSCTGSSVTVNDQGYANIKIDQNAADPMIAIHAESKL